MSEPSQAGPTGHAPEVITSSGKPWGELKAAAESLPDDWEEYDEDDIQTADEIVKRWLGGVSPADLAIQIMDGVDIQTPAGRETARQRVIGFQDVINSLHTALTST